MPKVARRRSFRAVRRSRAIPAMPPGKRDALNRLSGLCNTIQSRLAADDSPAAGRLLKEAKRLTKYLSGRASLPPGISGGGDERHSRKALG